MTKKVIKLPVVSFIRCKPVIEALDRIQVHLTYPENPAINPSLYVEFATFNEWNCSWYRSTVAFWNDEWYDAGMTGIRHLSLEDKQTLEDAVRAYMDKVAKG